MAEFNVLDVRLHGESIGTMTRFGRDRVVFGFDRSYVEDSARATLSLSFKDPFGHLVTDIEPTRTRAHPFFSNLLPEGSLREYLARSAGIDPRLEFRLLGGLGEDLSGAVSIVPIGPDSFGFGGGSRGFGGRVQPGRGTPDSAVRPLFRTPGPLSVAGAPLRYSLAGTQLKVPAMMSAGRLIVPRYGVGGTWIIKLPSPGFPGLTEQEHAMMRLAALVGINVPETRLVPVESIEGLPLGMGEVTGDALAVRRFDRLDDGTPVHSEDFAQILGAGPGKKYGGATYRGLAEIIGREIGDDAVAEFIRRLVFCALIGNGDAHLKNWSVIYPDGRTPELAPAYDLVSTIAYSDGDRMALEWLNGAAGFADLSEGLIARMASGARLPQRPVVRVARETVERFREAWGAEKDGLGVPGEVVGAIEGNLGRVRWGSQVSHGDPLNIPEGE